MGTEKRERQKANRQARLAELERDQKRSHVRKRVIRIGLIVIVALAAAFGLSRLIGGGNDSVDATDTSASGTTIAGTIPGEAPSTPPTVPGKTLTGATPCPAVDGSSARVSKFAQPPPMCIDTAKTYTAVVDTDRGSFTVALDAKKAPATVNNFVVLSRYHFYDGLIFHRIEPGFVVQGGDPKANGSGGPGYTVVEKPPSDLKYWHGVVAMAKSATEPDGASGSQFFVVTAQDADLPTQYALLGRIVRGLEVTDTIGLVPLQDPSSRDGPPAEPIVIESARLTSH